MHMYEPKSPQTQTHTQAHIFLILVFIFIEGTSLDSSNRSSKGGVGEIGALKILALPKGGGGGGIGPLPRKLKKTLEFIGDSAGLAEPDFVSAIPKLDRSVISNPVDSVIINSL